MKKKIVSTHIENDVVNGYPRLVYTDEDGIEWVMEHVTLCIDGGGTMNLVEKSKAWSFDPKNKKG